MKPTARFAHVTLVLCMLVGLCAPPRAAADPPASDELAALDERLASAPGDLDALAERAQTLLLVGDVNRALRDLDVGEALAPHDGRWALLRASCLVALGRDEEALSILDDGAIARSPRPSAALALRARVHLARGDDRSAILDLDAALGGGARLDIDLFVLRARAQARLGLVSDELAGLAEGVALTGAAVLEEELIASLARNGQSSEALRRIELATRSLAPGRRSLLRARILAGVGRDEDAIESAEEAVRWAEPRALRRPSAARWLELASALAIAGRCSEASERLERARALAPTYAEGDVPGLGSVATQVRACTGRGARP